MHCMLCVWHTEIHKGSERVLKELKVCPVDVVVQQPQQLAWHRREELASHVSLAAGAALCCMGVLQVGVAAHARVTHHVGLGVNRCQGKEKNQGHVASLDH